MLDLHASVLRALSFSLVLIVLMEPGAGMPLPDHKALCVDSSRNRLLWKVEYVGIHKIHLEYSSLNNAYRRPPGIDGSQPRTFFPDKPVYFWAPLDEEQSDHRWVLAGNAITVLPASLPPCSRHLQGECVGGVYDYCDVSGASGYCAPVTCNIATNQCERTTRDCPSDLPICVEQLKSCAECITSSDCQARSPIEFCDGGWHCNLEMHTCEQTPPPCDLQEAACDAETETCHRYACASHADCDDGNPCNGREICDFSLRTCYKDPLTPLPCSGRDDACDVVSGHCHECNTDVDCQPVGSMLYPCEPRKVCGKSADIPSLRECVDTPPVVQCEEGKHCDNDSGQCVNCVYDDDCYPEEVQAGTRRLVHCDGDFYCHKNECVHYGRCMDDSFPFCLEGSEVCSECRTDEECQLTASSFCSPTHFCNLQTGRCESAEGPCSSVLVTLANGVEAEMPTVCDEESRSCVQSVLCLDDSHCQAGTFCSLGETCNTFTGQCEVQLRDGSGALIPPSPCGDQPCLEDEQRCGYPTDVLITVGVLGAIWVLVLSFLAFLCACCGKLT